MRVIKVPLNLTIELTNLLTFVSNVATAIRMNSPYNGQYDTKKLEHGYAVLWFSDCLHNFEMLSNAIQQEYLKGIVFSCDTLISIYENYTANNLVESKGNPKVVFEKYNRGLFTLNDGIEILNAIKSKVI